MHMFVHMYVCGWREEREVVILGFALQSPVFVSFSPVFSSPSFIESS